MHTGRISLKYALANLSFHAVLLFIEDTTGLFESQLPHVEITVADTFAHNVVTTSLSSTPMYGIIWRVAWASVPFRFTEESFLSLSDSGNSLLVNGPAFN